MEKRICTDMTVRLLEDFPSICEDFFLLLIHDRDRTSAKSSDDTGRRLEETLVPNATSLPSDYQATRGDTCYHYVAQYSDVIVFVLTCARIRFDATGERQRQCRVYILKKVTDLLVMINIDAFCARLAASCKIYADLRDKHANAGSYFCKSLARIGISAPLTPHEVEALFLTRHYTKNGIRFSRRYVGGVPPMQLIMDTRRSFMSTSARHYLLHCVLQGLKCCTVLEAI